MYFIKENWNLLSMCYFMLKWDCFKQSDCREAERFGSSCICFSIILCFLLKFLLWTKWLLCEVQAQTFSLQDTSAADPAQRRCSLPLQAHWSQRRAEKGAGPCSIKSSLGPNTNKTINLLVLPPQQGPSHCSLIWWAGLVMVGSDEGKAEACSTYQT